MALVVLISLCSQPGFIHAQTNSRVIAWGLNYSNQTNVPPGLTNLTAIAGGGSHSMAIESDGTVIAWGNNSYRQCYVPWYVNYYKARAIAAGGRHSLALMTDGKVVAWGDNRYHQTNVPESLYLYRQGAAIAAGGFHSLALMSNGVVVAWGYNTYSQTNVPAGLSNVKAVAAGGYHSLALKSDGTLVAWGWNSYGQCNVPTGLDNIISIAGGSRHSLALKSDGTVTAWGDNKYGQTNVPPGLSNVIAIAAGGYHSLALRSDHTVVAWGAGEAGQTNDPNYGQSMVPLDLNGVAAIAAGGSVSLALIGRPRIESPPQDLIVVPDSNIEFKFATTGTTPLTNQWFFNDTNLISGATNSLLQLTNVQMSQSGAYTLVVSNCCGSATSSPAMLTVAAAPVIVSQPQNKTIWPGAAASFSVTAVGLLPMTYQWFFNTNPIIQGTSATLNLVSVQPFQTGIYTVVVANDHGAVTSAPTLLEFYPAVTVSNCTEPSLRAAMARGGTITFACDGTIQLANTITIAMDVVLDGSGHGVTISGNHAVRVFAVETNAALTLNHLTISDGLSLNGGGAILNLGSVNASDCNFWNNTATNSSYAVGGAICNEGTMHLDLCSFMGNQARGGLILVNEWMYWGGDGYGGAICNDGALVIHRSDFTENWALGGDPGPGDTNFMKGFGGGGAIVNYLGPEVGSETTGSLWMESSTIGNNTAWEQGGGLANFGKATLINTTFVENNSSGGAIRDPYAGVRLANCTLAFNNGPGITSAGTILINTLLATNSGNCSGSITDGGHNLSSDATCNFTNIGSMNSTDPRLGPLADNGGPTLTLALLPGSPAIDAGDADVAPVTDQRGVPRTQGSAPDIGAFEYLYTPVFTGAEVQNSTNRQLQMSGFAPDQTLTLQASTNLLNWFDVTNFTCGKNGAFECVDPILTNVQMRFYRLKSQSP